MNNIKILIVDDEKPARALIKKALDWEKYGYEICGEAINGKKGFELYEKLNPDIIITDVQMPVMSGLELIRKIRESNCDQAFIVLSCYENFSYAKEAIQMNVEDYIIKDLINSDELLHLLESIKAKLNRRHETFNVESNSVSSDVNFYVPIKELKNAILKNDIAKVISIVNLKNNMRYYIFIVSIDNYFVPHNSYESDDAHMVSTNELLKNKFKELIDRLIESRGEGIKTAAYMGKGKVFCLVEIENFISENKQNQKLNAIASKIRRLFLEEVTDHTLSISISSKFNKSELLIEKYNEAYETIKFRMFIGKNKTIFYGTIRPQISQISELFIAKWIKEIAVSLEHSDKEGVNKLIDESYSKQLSKCMQYRCVKDFNSQLFYILSKYCIGYGISYKQLFGVNYMPVDAIERYDTVDEIKDYMIEIFLKAIALRASKTNYSKHILDAIKYVNENCIQGITLNEIAKDLNLHKVYLSRLFREVTGTTLTKYILDQRMKVAKELIDNTNLKFYEISEKVGYANAQHFMVSFKKNEGITPKEYREKNINS